jgi:hypothetical protein
LDGKAARITKKRNEEETMKIILLTGSPHCGKTSTMENVYEDLTKNMKNKPIKEPIPKTAQKDFQCQMTYKNKKIAIFSAGDSLILILMAIFKYSEVDYLILPFSQGKKEGDKAKIIKNFIAVKQHTHINKMVCKKSASSKDKETANKNDCKKIITALK